MVLFLTSAANRACESLLTVLRADILGARVRCYGVNLAVKAGLNSLSQMLELFGEVTEPLGDEVLLEKDLGQGVGLGRLYWVSVFCLKLFASQDCKIPQAMLQVPAPPNSFLP